MLINSSVLSSEATQDSSLNRVLLKEVFGPLYSSRSVNQTTVRTSATPVSGFS